MFDRKKIEQAVENIIEAIGEDPNREGLIDTPKRVAEMYEEIFKGLKEDPAEQLEVLFTEQHDEMILVKDIPFYSLCEHHFLPFLGKAHVAYVPMNGRVTGLSKLARIVELYARRPQMQERLTTQIANLLMEKLDPDGVAVVIEAEHLCISMRGINKPGSSTVTSAVRGCFREDEKTRTEVLSFIMGK